MISPWNRYQQISPKTKRWVGSTGLQATTNDSFSITDLSVDNCVINCQIR